VAEVSGTHSSRELPNSKVLIRYAGFIGASKVVEFIGTDLGTMLRLRRGGTTSSILGYHPLRQRQK
jgi:hypothetical protein